MKNTFPEVVMFAYNTFLKVATEEKCVFAGLLMRENPPAIAVIGNVTETGCAFADLLRDYADIIDKSTADGRIERPDAQ